jgi:hypothetical protein
MAYMHIRINGVVSDTDPTTRAPRIRVMAEEVEPRKMTINLKNADAQTIMQFEHLTGKVAMVPLREGMMNGQTFFSLLQDPIIELPSVPAKNESPKPSAVPVNPNVQTAVHPVPAKTA